MPNRREALKLMAGAVLAVQIEPAPRRTIDLMQFCDTTGESLRWHTIKPFEQEDWTYATDARICVRVQPQSGDIKGEELGKVPRACGLPYWDHATHRVWQPLKPAPLVTSGTWCFQCEGRGQLTNGVVPECEECDGVGCQECVWRDTPGDKCPRCQGSGWHDEPWLMPVGKQYVDVRYAKKLLRIGEVEYVPRAEYSADAPIRFRFAEGVGLLMPVSVPEEVRT